MKPVNRPVLTCERNLCSFRDVLHSDNRRLFVEIPRDVNGNDSTVSLEKQERGQQVSALIVEKIVIPTRFDQMRNHNRNVSIRVLTLQLENMVHDGLKDEAIW